MLQVGTILDYMKMDFKILTVKFNFDFFVKQKEFLSKFYDRRLVGTHVY